MNEQGGLKELPRGWVSTISGELCAYITSGSRDWKQFYSSSGALFIRTQDINTDKLILEDVAYVSLPDDVEGKRSLVEPYDLLVTITGANVGKVAAVPEGIPEAYVSQSVGLLKLKDKQLAKFFHYYLQAEEAGRGQLNRMVYGVGRPVLSLQNLREIPVQLPPLNEQHRIVAKIEELFTKLDAGVEALRTARAQLGRFRQAVLKAAVTGELTKDWRMAHQGAVETSSVLLGKIREERDENAETVPKKVTKVEDVELSRLPDGWLWIRLGEVCFIQGGYAFKSADYKERGIPLLRISNIVGGKVTFDRDVVFLDEKYAEMYKTFLLLPGDIVVALSGATTGKFGVFDSDEAALLNQRVGRLRYYAPSLISQRYILYQMELMRESILKQAYGAAQPNISPNDLAEFVLAFPPLEEQHKIAEEIDHLFSIADATERAIGQSLKQAERLRQSILKQAFEGKLVPQDPADEPAEALLARIREERVRKQDARQKVSRAPRKAKREAQMTMLD